MKIQVTRTDINNGQRGSCKYCPVALAVCRTFGTNDVTIGASTIRVGHTKYAAPEAVRLFITLFDNGKYPPPFEFEV